MPRQGEPDAAGGRTLISAAADSAWRAQPWGEPDAAGGRTLISAATDSTGRAPLGHGPPPLDSQDPRVRGSAYLVWA